MGSAGRTLYWGYFLANRIATCDAINPAPPVMRTFFASYGSLAGWVSAVIFRAVSPSPFAFPGVGGAQSIYIFSAIVAKASRNGWTGSFLSFTHDSLKNVEYAINSDHGYVSNSLCLTWRC